MTRTRAKNRPDATGRNPTSRFVRLDHRLLTSNAYRSLTPNARALLVELAMLENGSNNGSLYLSVRDAADRIGVADVSAASKAFTDLTAMGFIQMTHDSHFRVKASEKSRARCWRLTWVAGPGRKAPSWDLLDREPEPKTRARRRMDRGLRALAAYRKDRDLGRLPVLDCDTLAGVQPASAHVTVWDSDTLNGNNGGIAPSRHVRENATHSADHGGGGQTADGMTIWGAGDISRLSANLVFASLVSAIHGSAVQ
jgi:hypothetical protein